MERMAASFFGSARTTSAISLVVSKFVVLFSAINLLSSFAQANIADAYGFGVRSASLGGTSVSGHDDGYDAALNPAVLAKRNGKRLRLSASIVFLQPEFKSINNIVVVNDFTGDKSSGAVDRGNVDNHYKPTFGTLLGASAQLTPDFGHLSFGVSIFTPVSQVAYIDSGETFIPEYVLYRSRTQRPQIEFAFASELAEGVFLGVGSKVAFSLSTKADVFLQSSSTTSSSMRFSTSMRPRLVPYAGLLFAPKNSLVRGGVVFRAAADSPSTLVLGSSARVLGPLSAMNFAFASNSSVYYDPMSVELGGEIDFSSDLKFFGQLDYQRWSAFHAPALSVEINKTSGVSMTNAILPLFQYRDILIPRAGIESKISPTTTLRGGYSYRPSILKALPTGAGNYLDPDRHNFGLGLGYFMRDFLGIPTGATFDLNGTFQYLVTQTIRKTAGNELGTGSGDLKIGAPGYEAGGFVWGFGTGLTVQF